MDTTNTCISRPSSPFLLRFQVYYCAHNFYQMSHKQVTQGNENICTMRFACRRGMNKHSLCLYPPRSMLVISCTQNWCTLIQCCYYSMYNQSAINMTFIWLIKYDRYWLWIYLASEHQESVCGWRTEGSDQNVHGCIFRYSIIGIFIK